MPKLKFNQMQYSLRNKDIKELKYTECLFCSEPVNKKHVRTCHHCGDTPICKWCIDNNNCCGGPDVQGD